MLPETAAVPLQNGTLRFNPDAHWSAAFYRSLNILQYTDGRDICNVNRDDAAGFRLDSLTTHHQYTSPTVKGKATHTDYVNRYPSVLPTTSYNFFSTDTTEEYCACIVKAQSLHCKNPTQHDADFTMLQQKEVLAPVFENLLTGKRKSILCVCCDGSSDEGPSHEEVQFLWTERHLTEENEVTLVTTRSSGSSYFNRIELQNGCLSRAHSNLFIPSTLNGSCTTASGIVDKDVNHQNLSDAIDIYIQRCGKSPCGQTVIHPYRGAESDQIRQKMLLTFLKCNKQTKEELQSSEPATYEHFLKVWEVRERHIVPYLPLQYIFCLRCCYKKKNAHIQDVTTVQVRFQPGFKGGLVLINFHFLFPIHYVHGEIPIARNV